MSQPVKLTPIPGAIREIDLAYPGWALGELEADLAAVGKLIKELFPDMLSVTVGRRGVSLKLQVCQEIPVQHVLARRAVAMGKLYAWDEQRARELLIDGDGPEAKELREVRARPHPGANQTQEESDGEKS